MASIVLVSGTWLGAWAWDGVTAALREAGHDVHPATLTGVAERAGETGPEVNLDTHTEDLVRLVTDRDLQRVVLVGHSYGGFPVTAAAARLPGRIARVVYVDSGPPPEGVCQFDMHAPAEQQRLRALVGDGQLPPPAWDPAREPYLDGLDQAALTRLRKLSTSHPFASVTQPFHSPGRPAAPVTLIACIFPLEQVRAMIDAGHPFFAALGDADLRELPTGHWPMLSEPERLATMLAETLDETPAGARG